MWTTQAAGDDGVIIVKPDAQQLANISPGHHSSLAPTSAPRRPCVPRVRDYVCMAVLCPVFV
jgi:hypothetical protein